ncbi:hypothetical protein ACXYTH_03750, partial [Escherichia coli]
MIKKAVYIISRYYFIYIHALQGNYTLARKTQAVEFNDKGDIDT